MIKYALAPDLNVEVKKLAHLFPYLRLDSVVCIRSNGSKSRGTIARCHALNKVMQIALGRFGSRQGFYVIEVISERFDKLAYEEKIKTLIHEVMHIPKSFGGGFKYHDYVCKRNIEKLYKKYEEYKEANEAD